MIKKLLYSLIIGAPLIQCLAQPQFNPNIYPIGGTSGSNSGPTANTTGTNVQDFFVTNSLVIGAGGANVNISATNSPTANGQPFVLWNTYIDWNTNFMYASGAGLATGITNWNGVYYLTNLSQATYYKTSIRQVTNYGSYWGAIGASQALVFSNAFGPSSLFSAYANVNGAAYNPTNTTPTWTFGTNTVWSFQTFGSATNAAGATNGISMTAISNGVPYTISSQIGSTNQTWALLPPLIGFPSGTILTNSYTTNVALDFASTSVGSAQELQCDVSTSISCVYGDEVIVTPPNNPGLFGVFQGSCTNGLIRIKFVPTAATQDPAIGNYRLTVRQYR